MQELKLDKLILDAGFAPESGFEINNSNWWFGVCLNHPDLILKRKKKTVILSLSGQLSIIAINRLYRESPEQYNRLLPITYSVNCKYICFRDNDKIIFETFTGENPSGEILNQFLK